MIELLTLSLALQSTIVRSARSPDTGELVAYSPNYYYPVITKSSNLVSTLETQIYVLTYTVPRRQSSCVAQFH